VLCYTALHCIAWVVERWQWQWEWEARGGVTVGNTLHRVVFGNKIKEEKRRFHVDSQICCVGAHPLYCILSLQYCPQLY